MAITLTLKMWHGSCFYILLFRLCFIHKIIGLGVNPMAKGKMFDFGQDETFGQPVLAFNQLKVSAFNH